MSLTTKKKKFSQKTFLFIEDSRASNRRDTHQFKNEPFKRFHVWTATNNLDGTKTTVTLLEMPLIIADSLKQGVVGIRNIFQDHDDEKIGKAPEGFADEDVS